MYLFTKRALPGPGTGDLSFQPLNMLPAYAVRGAGTVYSDGIPPIGEPQLYYGQALTIDGMPGIAYQGIGPTGVMDMDAYLSNLQSAQKPEGENG